MKHVLSYKLFLNENFLDYTMYDFKTIIPLIKDDVSLIAKEYNNCKRFYDANKMQFTTLNANRDLIKRGIDINGIVKRVGKIIYDTLMQIKPKQRNMVLNALSEFITKKIEGELVYLVSDQICNSLRYKINKELSTDESITFDADEYEPEWLKAIRFNDFNKFKELINSGLDVNSIYDDLTILMYIINDSRIHFLEYLLKYKPDLNIQDNFGYTALMRATHENKINIVKKLIDAGADINIKDNTGISAIFSSSNKDSTLFKLFINAGADVSIIDKLGNDIVDMSHKRMLYEPEIQRMLLSRQPILLKSLLKYEIPISDEIKKEFPHLFAATDFNLL